MKHRYTFLVLLAICVSASGRAQFSGGFGSGATVSSFSAAASLPLTLIYFDGHSGDQLVTLEWATVNEVDTDHFIVERTVDGKEYLAIGKLAAAGTSTPGQTLRYTLDDTNPVYGTALYRLKSVDVDGTTYYSDLVEIDYGKDAPTLTFAISPNPSSGTSVGIDLGSISGEEPVAVDILDPAGRLIATHQLSAHSGDRVEVRLRNRLPVGSYLLRMSQATAGSRTERLLVGQSR